MRKRRSKESYQPKTEETAKKRLEALARGRKTQALLRSQGIEPIKGAVPPGAQRYREDIITWAEEQYHLRDGRIKLEQWQKNDVLRPLFYKKDERGRRKYSFALISTPKKNGKSELGALICTFLFFCGPTEAEIYLAASDKDQSSLVGFKKIKKAIGRNNLMFHSTKIYADALENKKNGNIIRVLPASLTSSGLNPYLVWWDELWQFDREMLEMHFEELTQPPTWKEPLTLITTYAGFDQDSLLYRLYEKGRNKEDPKMFFYWSHENLASWITPEYLQSQKGRLRPNTYIRLHENRWASGLSQFISGELWEGIKDNSLTQAPAGARLVYIGVDIGLKSDCSAIAAVAHNSADSDILELIDHEVFIPDGEGPLDLEATVENALKRWGGEYSIIVCVYDPWQFSRSAQTLSAEGLPMLEFNQTSANVTAYSQNLYQLVRNKRLKVYPSEEVKTHLLNCEAKESPRGWRIVKRKQSKKIDLAVAMAMACYAASEQMEGEGGMTMEQLQEGVLVPTDYKGSYRRW